jgi:RNA polymerase sigma-70 factor, ECF subfamily
MTTLWPLPNVVAEAALAMDAVDRPLGEARFARLFEAYYDFVWRSLRRLGVRPDGVDDAAQEVFVVASRRLDEIEPLKERSFLFGTAMRVASEARRAAKRRPEDLEAAFAELIDPGPSLDELAERRRARALLDWVLATMPLEQRAVFTLFELEGLTMAEVAEDLGLAMGTVASRLRRGRELYEQAVTRLKAQEESRGRR